MSTASSTKSKDKAANGGSRGESSKNIERKSSGTKLAKQDGQSVLSKGSKGNESPSKVSGVSDDEEKPSNAASDDAYKLTMSGSDRFFTPIPDNEKRRRPSAYFKDTRQSRASLAARTHALKSRRKKIIIAVSFGIVILILLIMLNLFWVYVPSFYGEEEESEDTMSEAAQVQPMIDESLQPTDGDIPSLGDTTPSSTAAPAAPATPGASATEGTA